MPKIEHNIPRKATDVVIMIIIKDLKSNDTISLICSCINTTIDDKVTGREYRQLLNTFCTPARYMHQILQITIH